MNRTCCVRGRAYGALALTILLALSGGVAACGGDDDDGGGPAATSVPSPSAVAESPTAAPTSAPAATETAAVTASEEVTNGFEVKVAVVKSLSSADAAKLTLPAHLEAIDKLDVSDFFNAGNSMLRIGIADGAVLAPADGKIERVESLSDSPLGGASKRILFRLADQRVAYMLLPADATVNGKEGDSVTRGTQIASAPTRFTGATGAGYTLTLEYAGSNLQARYQLNSAAWVGAKPAVYKP